MWCPLPWTHIGVKNNGTLRMCSHSQSMGTGNTVLHNNNKPLSLENIDEAMNSDTLKQVRKTMLTGEYPEQCKRCQTEHSAGYRSRDEWETLRHIDTFTREMAINNTLEDGTLLNPQIQDMDLRVGNQCNLRCVMCFPGEATKWYKDYEYITGDKTFNVDGKVYTLIQNEGDFDWVRSEQKIESLLNHSNNLLKIKFGGGEPLMIKHHQDLIEGLIDRGYSKNIELEYSSNLTIFPEKLFKLWEQFKLIKICASLDGIGQVNEAIRYPTDWNIVENNLKMLDNTDDHIEVFTSTTINLLSIEHYADTLNWLESQNYRKINKKAYNISASHPVYNPKYLSISILDKDSEDELFNMLLDKTVHKDKILFYKKFIELTRTEDPLYRKQFSERFYRFAQNQQQDWDKLFPFISKLAKKYV